jgi:hypothetical protein
MLDVVCESVDEALLRKNDIGGVQNKYRWSHFRGATMPVPPNHHESDKQRERATTRYEKLRDKGPLNIDLIKLSGLKCDVLPSSEGSEDRFSQGYCT